MAIGFLDLYGVLDRCSECDARAKTTPVRKGWLIECSECANCIDVFKNKSEATTTWNKQQRASVASRNNERGTGR